MKQEIKKKFFEVTVRYERYLEEKAKARKFTETYLIDAQTFSEAEAVILGLHLSNISNAPVEITAAKISNATDVFPDHDGDAFYRVKHYCKYVNEADREVREAECFIIQAHSIDRARQRYKEITKDYVGDWQLESIAETHIVQYIPHI